MVVLPPCKINLGLNIIRKRSDGYHDIESVFMPIPMRDVLEAVPKLDEGAKGMTLHLSGLPIPGKDNILNNIWHTLSGLRNLSPVNVYLHKVIPFGAGLGGGSSDAAWFIRLLNEMLELKLSKEEMHQAALSAGSDCPFFLYDQACFVQGRGEIISPLDFSLKDKFVLLVFPEVHISTAEAYAGVFPEDQQRNIPEILLKPIQNWKELLFNDFEKSIFPKYPQLREIKEMLYSMGALYASMSGSGSTIFGIFEKPIHTLPANLKHFCASL
jgi:4-diphosphocytidyl-2-C-methyl-D-erythritol kinase